MLKIYIYTTLAILSFFPFLVEAQTTFKQFVEGTLRDLASHVAVFLFSLALLVFLWGVAKFILKADNDTERAKGKQVMLWGLIALFVMLSVWGIVYILAQTFFPGEVQFYLPEDGGGFNI